MATAAQWLLATIFAGAAIGKFSAYDRFLRTLVAIPWLPLSAARVAARLVPGAELVLALGLLAAPQQAAVCAIALLLVFTGVILFERAAGRDFSCACFGGVDPGSAGRDVHLRNVLLVALALLVVAAPSTDEPGAILVGLGCGLTFLVVEAAIEVIGLRPQ